MTVPCSFGPPGIRNLQIAYQSMVCYMIRAIKFRHYILSKTFKVHPMSKSSEAYTLSSLYRINHNDVSKLKTSKMVVLRFKLQMLTNYCLCCYHGYCLFSWLLSNLVRRVPCRFLARWTAGGLRKRAVSVRLFKYLKGILILLWIITCNYLLLESIYTLVWVTNNVYSWICYTLT